MATNPMYEIVIEAALNVLSDAEEILSNEIAHLEGEIATMKRIVPERDGAELVNTVINAREEKLSKYKSVNESIKKVIRQGNSLDL